MWWNQQKTVVGFVFPDHPFFRSVSSVVGFWLFRIARSPLCSFVSFVVKGFAFPAAVKGFAFPIPRDAGDFRYHGDMHWFSASPRQVLFFRITRFSDPCHQC